MKYAKVQSAQPTLLGAQFIEVETDVTQGLHSFSIVGLPDKAVEEARDRISAAIKNSGYSSPKHSNQKTVVSLAPADLKKEGPVFDVAIALSYLCAAEAIDPIPDTHLFLGELALDGTLRPLRGVLPAARAAAAAGITALFVPKENAEEAALIEGLSVYPAGTLSEIIAHRAAEENGQAPERGNVLIAPQPRTELSYTPPAHTTNFDDIRGQKSAKRGLAIAAAGRHNIALYGPPGTGKTMLARALATILPPLSFEEALEVTGIHSSAGAASGEVITHPPLRAPHHTASHVSIIGGGAALKPGEVTLAHRGVLFLDEFPEFDRRVIETLRQPLEEKVASVSRARGSAQFPAHFILVAAMNPCPCGNFESEKECTCAPNALLRYRQKVSGPIADRIDMWIEVPALPMEELAAPKNSGDTETKKVRGIVEQAAALQAARFASDTRLTTNTDMGVRDLERYVPLSDSQRTLLAKAADTYQLSPRGYHRVIKLARTIADLAESNEMKEEHLLEALQYRPKEMSAV